MLKSILFTVSFSLSVSSFQAQSPGKLYKAGMKAMKEHKYSEAQEDFTQSLNLAPGAYKVLLGRAQAYEYGKELPKSIADYQAALAQKPKNYRVYLKIADLDISLSQYADALATLLKLTSFDEWNRDAIERIIWCHIRLKQFAEAKKVSEYAVNGDKHHYIKQNHVINYYYAIALDSLKDYHSAVLTYIKALSLIPNPPSGQRISPVFKTYYADLATAQYHLNQADEALKNYSIASTLDPADTVAPKNYRIYYLRSYAYQAKSDYSNAFGDLDRAVVMNPKDPELFLHRAAVYQKTSNYHSAISDFTKAALLDPQSAVAFKGRGGCYLELANFTEAIADLRHALELNATDAEAKEWLDRAEKKNYDANKETDAPEIKVDYPVADFTHFVNIYESQLDVLVTGQVHDKSKLKFIKVNGLAAEVKDEEKTHYFTCKVPVNAELTKLEVTAQDIYSNQGTVTMKIGRLVDDSRVSVTFRGKLLADDAARTPLANRVVYMCNEHGEALYEARTDAEGAFRFYKLPFDKNYMLTMDVSDSPLAAVEKYIITDEKNNAILHAVVNGKAKYRFEILQSDYHAMTLMSMDDEPLKVDLKGKLLADNDNRSPLANVNMQLLNEKSEVIATQKTDGYGFFIFAGVLPDVAYSIKIDTADARAIPFNKVIITDIRGKIIKEIAKGVFGYFIYQPLNTERSMIASISEPDPWLKAIKLNKTNSQLVIIDNLYYESGAFNITPTFEPELNKAVDAMKGNPGLVLEIQSHTDAVAGDDYNMELSQKRATAVADYMVSKGVDKKRITAKGYGETMLINRCANGVECSDAEHKQNRRTVFKLNYPIK